MTYQEFMTLSDEARATLWDADMSMMRNNNRHLKYHEIRRILYNTDAEK